jgi:anti-sigma B factor antagonist
VSSGACPTGTATAVPRAAWPASENEWKERLEAMANLTISERTVGAATVLDLSGRITLGEESVLLRDTVRGLLERGAKNILINLGGVSYVDSSGIGNLVGCYTTVKNQGGQLKLLNLTRKIEDLLMITKLLTVFDTFDDEAEAIGSFR